MNNSTVFNGKVKNLQMDLFSIRRSEIDNPKRTHLQIFQNRLAVSGRHPISQGNHQILVSIVLQFKSTGHHRQKGDHSKNFGHLNVRTVLRFRHSFFFTVHSMKNKLSIAFVALATENTINKTVSLQRSRVQKHLRAYQKSAAQRLTKWKRHSLKRSTPTICGYGNAPPGNGGSGGLRVTPGARMTIEGRRGEQKKRCKFAKTPKQVAREVCNLWVIILSWKTMDLGILRI